MEILFKKVELDDRDRIQAATLPSPYRNCDFSFANMYNWREYYQTEVAFYKGMVVIRFHAEEGDRPAYLMPVGNGPLDEVLTDMDADMQEQGYPMMLMAINETALHHLEETYPENLHVLNSRDYSDYIYEREKLASLSGKQLQSKRNHVNRFIKNYPDYLYEPITDANLQDCLDLEDKWYRSSERTADISAERRMVITALNNREAIGMTGGCIRVDGKVIAFSLGMPINHDTFGVNIEKADTDYDGSFTIINREFARNIPEQYTYVNREEDLGIEGLRKAKLSYRPSIILDKYTVLLRYEQDED